MTRRIFVDTSFFLSILWSQDAHHQEAAAVMRRLGTSDSLVTTGLVRGETWTMLRRRSGHGRAIEFLDAVESSPRYRVGHVTPELERDALDWLRQRDDREYSFVDATSFAFMRHEGLVDALAFDGDFSAAGFVELRA